LVLLSLLLPLGPVGPLLFFSSFFFFTPSVWAWFRASGPHPQEGVG
jgi:hypothetical protein